MTLALGIGIVVVGYLIRYRGWTDLLATTALVVPRLALRTAERSARIVV